MTKLLVKLKQAVALSQHRERVGGLESIQIKARNLGGFKWVLLGFLVAAAYYGFVASDRYVTEAQVYVKSADTPTAVLPQMPMIAGLSSGAQDTLLVREYIHSYDMLQHLDARLDLKSHFSSRDRDMIARLKKDPTAEDFLDYYREHVELQLNPESNILNIRSQGFSRQFSLDLADEIIRESERYINQVSQKIAEDEISFVTQEMERAKSKLTKVRDQLLLFQNDNNLLDPFQNSAAMQGVVNQLKGELVQLQTQEKALASYLNDDAAELVTVRAKIDAVKVQVGQEEKKIASKEGQSINIVNAQFAEMEMELKFATDMYKSTLVGFETARVEAYRKLKHLVVVQSPSLPDEALYPRKAYNLTTLFVLLSLAYGIATMILATIREHRDV